jgi:PAS domain S-box-containing protein
MKISSLMSGEPENLYPLILDSVAEGVFAVDSEYRITYFNAAAETITGFTRDRALGRKCYEVLRASICQKGCALRRSLETGRTQRNVKVTILNPDMEAIPLSVSSSVLRDADGRMIGGVEIFQDVSEVETLRSELSGRRVFGDMIGASPAMQEIFRLIPDVASTDASVLIEGASGTGKELVARAIHDLSQRREHAFVRVNCGALPDTLLESELFGYVRGAFTDARRSKPGRFQQADGGTLFLDEVGDLSAAFQVKLLRALQDGEVQPLGSTETLNVDVRVIAATNRDLRQRISEGKFREDLFYRICVIPIHVPPLKERREDILPLLEHHMERLAARTGRSIRRISQAAMTALYDYDYPGNVRELINILERAFVLCHGERIDMLHLPAEVVRPLEAIGGSRRSTSKKMQYDYRGTGAAAGPDQPGGAEPGAGHCPFRAAFPRGLELSGDEAPDSGLAGSDGTAAVRRLALQNMWPEVRALLEALDAQGWNREETARALGISRSTLWRRMRQWGLIKIR